MTQLHKTIAIVGCGPKGLYALDALCREAQKVQSCQFNVHLYEASPYPGAGPIYDPGQPDFLLMNFPAHMVNAWTDGCGPDLMTWLDDAGAGVAANAYVPRAVVGRYLCWCFREVVKAAPANLNLTMHLERVLSLRRKAENWLVSPDDVSTDEVLITTGHQDWARDEQSGNGSVIHSPFPVDAALTSAEIPSGTSVVCKGFALTFIDTVLALTEGRGGVFTKGEDDYSYRPSGTEPALIAPFSRTGRPMRAKVDMDMFIPPQDDPFWRAQIRIFDETMAARFDVSFRDDMWPALQQIADNALKQVPGTAAAFLESWQDAPFSSERCQDELRKGYEIAIGAQPADIGWALAEAWRRCYPNIIRWVSHREFEDDDAILFRQVAAEMERLAFGPPAQNVGKLICLNNAGLVSFDHLSGDFHGDMTINATIPAAGGAELSDPLAGLLRDGFVTIGPLGGLCVDDRAQAIKDGHVTPGFSIIGRATEGSILGNDTLSRILHDLPERWAKRVTRARTAPALTKLGMSA